MHGSQLARLLGRWQAPPGRHRHPAYVALAGAVRGLLADGRLAFGVRLPAERELADALDVSRTTVSAAYQHLRESGHLTSRRGAGSWTSLPAGHRVASSGLWAPADELDVIDLAAAAPSAPPQLPAAAAEAVDELPRYLAGPGYHPAGLPVLREEVAHGFALRGLPTSPDQIMITNGVQHALDLVLRLLVAPGQIVLVESPTYPNALAGLATRRARTVTYGLPDGGWDADLLLATLRQAGPRVAYLIPEFHNPTGHLMPAGLREALVRSAHSRGTDLIIDESFVDLPLGDDPMPAPVAASDRHSRVLSIGGMSKPYWGGLRIGWVRAAAPLVQRLAAVRVGVDMASPVLDQLVAVQLLRRADEIVPARRAELAARCAALATALRQELPEWRFTEPAGGVTLWAELDGPVSSALTRAAGDRGVRLAPGPAFGLDGTLERFLRLPFILPEGDLVEAVRRLAMARDELGRPHRPSWTEQTVLA